MKICGIDPSINSSGKCIMTLHDTDYSIQDVAFYGYNMTKNRCFTEGNVDVFHVGTKFNKMNMFDRQNLVYDFMKKDMDDVRLVAFEGYAFGKSKQGSGSLIQMGEFIGGLKKLFYDMGMGLVLYPPIVVKRFATGNTKADKIHMRQAFQTEYPQFYPAQFNKFEIQDDTPHSDMVDAFWMAETLRCHLIYDVLGSDALNSGVVALLEYKATKKSHSIIETEFFKHA